MGGTKPRATTAAGPATGLAWSPDGRILAVAAESGLLFLDGGSLAKLPSLPLTGPSSAVAFSKDGVRLATATLSNTVQLWDLAEGRLLRTLLPPPAATARPASPQRIVDVAFSPDGALLTAAVAGYYQGGQGSVWSWDTANGLDRQVVASYGTPARLAYRPGTSIIALASGANSCARGGGGVAVWDLAITQELRILSNQGDGVNDLAISADGAWLAATTSGAGSPRCIGPGIVQIWGIVGGEARRSLVDTGNAATVAIGPDGDRLAAGYVEGYVVLWQPATGERLASLPVGAAPVQRLAFNPDGTRLAVLDKTGRLTLWDL